MEKHLYSICFLGIWLVGMIGCAARLGNKPDEGPSPARTPAEELSTFQLESGLKIQLVASEPMVQDPVIITFDPDGRLWVVEMRGFMPTIDGTGEDAPVGRVSILEDKNGDGKMDASTIYLDSLVMPRSIALVPGGALIAHKKALWLTQDTNGDLKADTKTLIDADYAKNGLPEHSDNGLWRGMDNWYYNAKSRFRYKLINGKWQRDSTEFRGQWGISHDDKGRLYYNYNWSQLHADLVPPGYLSRNKNHTPTTGIDHGLTLDRRIFPIRPNIAVNRGYIPGTLDSTGRLLEFTAACSPLYYRGKSLPNSFYGNLFVCEPAGNLIKRNISEEDGLQLSARDPHPGKEFLASTDERFRPVHLATGPDGALYVADMYRGLVQHGAYVTPYLREQTLSRKLIQPIHYGRIWRIVPENWKPSRPEKLSTATSASLINRLSHPDGWHRDVAQRLLVERNDKSIVPALQQLAQKGDNHLGRFHALWTLEGIHQLDADLLFQTLTDSHSLVRATSLLLLEPMAKSNPQIQVRLENHLLKSWDKAPIDEVLQTALSASALQPETAHTILAGIAEKYGNIALIRDAILSSLPEQEFAFLQKIWPAEQWQTHDPAKEIFLEMLTTAVIQKANPTELEGLLALLETDIKTFGWREKTILTAIAVQGAHTKSKPIRLARQPGILIRKDVSLPPSQQTAIATLFEWPGHTSGGGLTQKKTLLSENEQKLFALGRQHYLTTCAGCHGTDGAGLNRFAPPLIASDWVLGDEKRLALLVLHGMEGPLEVNGKLYNAPEILPVMPAHSTMDDGAITAILTYIRNEWGNDAGPVSKGLVGSTRHTSQGRVQPWTAKELNQHILESKISNGGK